MLLLSAFTERSSLQRRVSNAIEGGIGPDNLLEARLRSQRSFQLVRFGRNPSRLFSTMTRTRSSERTLNVSMLPLKPNLRKARRETRPCWQVTPTQAVGKQQLVVFQLTREF